MHPALPTSPAGAGLHAVRRRRPGKCQRQITDKTAFMKFIEDQQADTPAQFGSFCRRRSSKPSVRTSIRVDSEIFRSEAHLVAHRAPASSPSSCAIRRAAMRAGTPGLEHQDAPGQPRLVQQQQRDQRRLAGTRFGGRYRMPRATALTAVPRSPCVPAVQAVRGGWILSRQ